MILLDQQEMMRADPTYVVEKQMFLSNSFPYLEVRRPFILGTREHRWKATLGHRFIELLHIKTNKLTRVYTQNIDGLDHQCSAIPKEKIVNVHGTISQASCEHCGCDVPFDDFCDLVQSSIKDIYGIDENAPLESSPILCQVCGKATVKPKTVLFGSNLPNQFFECSESDLPKADLLFVVGTSLVVSPANSLVYNVNSKCLRVIVNNEQVGEELGINYGLTQANGRDFFARGNCDEVFLELMKELDWMEDIKNVSHLLPKASADLL
jgi:NAD-dependent deacetylase sirtuin 2